MKSDPDSPVPLVADMSSDIFSRPVNVSKYGLIYAGAQKNLGPAGVTLVIIREGILGHFERPIPSMLNYKIHVENESLYNTPPVLAVYASLQTLIWLKNQGGVSGMLKINEDKAKLLYDEIERNRLFKCTVENPGDRSIMNVCFVMQEEYKELENSFLEFASSRGMTGIKGHRSVGGFRASLYNALPRESVLALIETMRDFEKSV
jgi:phosphoserine aminotransferase